MPPRRQILTLTLFAAGIWAALVGISLILESHFNRGGPEYFAPIPAFFLSALFLGWIPALLVGWWIFGSK